MTQAQRPFLPQTGDTPDQRRLLSGLQELLSTLLSVGVFLVRPSVSPVIRPTAEAAGVLVWDTLNRVELQGNATVLLPIITAKRIGSPLYVAKLTGTGTLTYQPSGRSIATGVAPLINNAATLTQTGAALNVLMTDGVNWFIT